MRREIHYHWRVREHMARAGMKNSRDLVGPLRARGITYRSRRSTASSGKNPTGSRSKSLSRCVTSSVSKQVI